MQSISIRVFAHAELTRRVKTTWKLTSLFLLFFVFSPHQFVLTQAIGGGQIQGTITDANGSV